MLASMRPLRQREIFGYAVGDLGINFSFQLIGFWLAYFYTDVFGISPAHVAGLFLVARIWDAVNDPIMGYIADHTRSRWGRFRPYLLFGAVPLNLVLLACFYTPEFSSTGRIVYAYVTYIMHGMLFTAVGLPYSSISAVMTQDQQERAVISTYRMFFAVIVAMSIVTIGVEPFVSLFASEQQGFFVLAALFGIASTGLLWFSFTQSKERVQAPRETYRIRDMAPILFKNDALLVLAIAMMLNTCVWVIGGAVTIYFFKYVVGDPTLVRTFFFFMLPANVLGVIAAPQLTKRIGKARTFIWGSAGVFLLYGLRHFVPASMLALLIAVSMVGSFSQMLCSITQWGMLPDTVEYGQYKTGLRSEGIPFAFFSFVQKLGMALGGALAAYVLDLTGYVANAAQSETALAGIRSLFNLLPAGCSLACLIALLFYRLDAKTFERIKGEIAARDGASKEADSQTPATS
jgi:sugar (glycoside-pentoside-hexuronide) transporter